MVPLNWKLRQLPGQEVFSCNETNEGLLSWDYSSCLPRGNWVAAAQKGQEGLYRSQGFLWGTSQYFHVHPKVSEHLLQPKKAGPLWI